jgi:CRISPR-associated protein Csd2
MSILKNKIDFALVFSVHNANPNGDPLDGNRPRTNYDGYGEISDVCLKRKIRNRLQDMGQKIFVQSDDRSDDGCRSLKERLESVPDLIKWMKDRKAFSDAACNQWIDVRAFGQVFAFKKKDDQEGDSIGVRGPVSIQAAVSQDLVDVTSMQITKSVNLEFDPKNPGKKGSDTMGMKHRVDFGIYVTYGSINVQLAEKTGFTQDDALLIRDALRTLFENDVSSARPDGSMEVLRLYWWTHNVKTGQYPSAKVHKLLKITKKADVERARFANDYDIDVDELPGLACDKYIET